MMIIGPILFPEGGGGIYLFTYLFISLFMSCWECGILDETGQFNYPYFQNLLNFVILRFENISST